MFGHVQANLSDLSEEEQQRYRAAYCGLCKTLGKRYGLASRFALTYDLTFLSLLLSSLYEPEETCGNCRCAVHPCKRRSYAVNCCTEYAADMTIALTYHKCLDDWDDEHQVVKKLYAKILEKKYLQVKERWPEQCGIIEAELEELSKIEAAENTSPDAAAACFGRLMEGLFLYKKDHWEEQLRRLGFGLGQYIYLADAAVDLEKDRKKGRYNPLAALTMTQEELRPTLMTILGEASQAFEILPLVQDAHLLKNILYSGIWIKYNRGMQTKKREKHES